MWETPHIIIFVQHMAGFTDNCDNLHLDGLIHVAYRGGFTEPASLITY